MGIYRTLMAYATAAVIGLGLFGCQFKEKTIEGTVKSEVYQSDFCDGDRYVFTLLTEDGFKILKCKGEGIVEMDSLLEPGDKIRLEGVKHWIETDDYINCLESLVELNGKPYSSK